MATLNRVTAWRYLENAEPDETCDADQCVGRITWRIGIWERTITVDGVEYIQLACEKHAVGLREPK
jgi:hypothetical protein